MFWKLFMLLSVILSGSQGDQASFRDAIIHGDRSAICREFQQGTRYNYDTAVLAARHNMQGLYECGSKQYFIGAYD